MHIDQLPSFADRLSVLRQRKARVLAACARLVVGALGAFGLLAAPATAYAGPLDLRFGGFVGNTPTDNKVKSAGLNSLIRELTFAIGPHMGGPVHSGGALGVDVGYEFTSAGVNAGESYWKTATSQPQDNIGVHTLRMRKGLPHSIQLGTSVSHVSDSNLYTLGAEVQASLLDGFRAIPDVGVRMGIQAVMGNPEADIVAAGFDGIVSKSFGIGGVLALQPWVGYQLGLAYANVRNQPIAKTSQAGPPDVRQFAQIYQTSNRMALGVRVVAARVQAGLELHRSITDAQNALTFKVGAVF